ncbi:SRPBCC family protein [Verrucosispora sioxanthis]|uniref:Polyketide cyclase n=1 Tax=Verrucosispora sioxanthis TaxID=2499994 RepID=A0A6M1L280_9ACTN|nr:SRPBCC family protein [Verrucosispora sioxanthis]NEE62430.1 polyketide cyclase [Verrucosispora sioxanthis]NGM11540.1 polyketide cyclase [Verrucosispora sioxanthis]
MTIAVERHVAADPATVWRIVSDVDRWAELLPTIDEIIRIDDAAPVTVGSRFRIRQPGLATARYEITDWRPGAGFTWQARTPGVRTTASHELRPEGSATRLRLSIDWDGPAARLVELLYGRRTRRLLEQEATVFARLASGSEGAR